MKFEDLKVGMCLTNNPINRGFYQFIKLQKKDEFRVYYAEIFASNSNPPRCVYTEDNISKKGWSEGGWEKLVEAEEKIAFKMIFMDESIIDSRLQ